MLLWETQLAERMAADIYEQQASSYNARQGCCYTTSIDSAPKRVVAGMALEGMKTFIAQ